MIYYTCIQLLYKKGFKMYKDAEILILWFNYIHPKIFMIYAMNMHIKVLVFNIMVLNYNGSMTPHAGYQMGIHAIVLSGLKQPTLWQEFSKKVSGWDPLNNKCSHFLVFLEF